MAKPTYLAAAWRGSGAGVLLAGCSPGSLRRIWPGLAIGVVIALAASFVATAYGGPLLLYALFFGLAFHFLAHDPVCLPGIEFCSKTLLRIGIAMLGARITLEQVSSLGAGPLLIVAGAVVSTILFGVALAALFGRPSAEGLLSGGAVGICGASAALAISALLPRTRENEHFTLLTVVGVTSMSTLAMIAYPLLAAWAGLDATQAGIFIGGAIHDVAQVVGAGYLMSSHTGDVATVVKLTRVACLLPVIVVASALYRRSGDTAGTDSAKRPPLMPLFLAGFLCLMLANSLHLVPAAAASAMNSASRACLVIAIATLGVKTSFQALASLGWRPVLMLAAETVWIALLVLAAIKFAL
ncbi:YeiH family protein [Pseudoduganella namucuonensis]|uniref:Conserved hypothetical integral membrane protein n=1 Tax=Pseudoduganella namucuonensis TaxID=1035707 RepID=A0A1I7INZ9_9BURK|nr:putative sulfate exporter family transporter [Pseudoduganella namucuonensis]SFU74627.1 conserved hypothetical integral membrane protein [Pseudoduganella namucuonensis]